MGYNLSGKLLAAVVIIACVGTGVAIAAIANLGGIGDALRGLGGPVGAAIVGALSMPLTWAVSGGGPTVLALYGIGLVILFGFAYWVWHWDIGYKISGAAAQPVTNDYTNTMNREPQEPERAPQTVPAS